MSMNKIIQMGIVFLKKSKMLTFSAFLSIFVACFLSICMFQLSSNVESSFEDALSKKKGDFDIQVIKENGETFTKKEIEYLQNENGVENLTKGYWSVELEDTYIVGVMDNSLNKSLYKYSKDIKKNCIVINTPLSRRLKKKVGDTIFLAGENLKIIEVLEEDSMAEYKMPMGIMELAQFHQLLGNADTEQANYILLQCQDSAFVPDETGKNIVERIRDYNSSFGVADERMGKDYQNMVKNARGLFKTFFCIVILVSGLFVVNIFMEYMRKYRKDMAIIRTVGGKQEQVQAIFFSMSVLISAMGCLAGAATSAVFSKVLLTWFNNKIQFFQGSIQINWQVLWKITGIVFVLFNIFVFVVFYYGQKVLPIQVFKETETGLRRNKKGNRFLGVRKIIGTEGYLGIKLMLQKFLQNFMIILIIALITALAYTGQASMKLLEINNNSYYYDLMQGKAACGEIQTQNPMTLSYVRQLSKRFQSVIDGGFMLFGEFEVETNVEDQEDIWFFRVTDLENLPELLSVEKWNQLEKVPKEQRIILEESMADLKGCHLGDTITLASDWLGGQKEFTVVEIVKEDTLYGWDHGAIVDWDNLCQPEQLEEQYSGCFLGFWLDGDKEVIREKFLQLEQEQVNFSWYIYEDVMEQSDLIMSQRVATMFVVLFMLLIVTGIGWLNSAKGMLVARKEEYGVLRMLGASSKRVRRICWIQVWSYMLSGIVLGVLLGIVVVYLLWSRNLNGNVSIRIYWEYIVGIVGYLFVLSLLLKPTIDNKDL